MDSVKGAMNDVQFDDSDSDFDSPIPYTAMYVQWEANKVIGQLYFFYILFHISSIYRLYRPSF